MEWSSVSKLNEIIEMTGNIGTLVAAIGTVIFGAIACWQNGKLRELTRISNNISKRLIEIEEYKRRSYVIIENYDLEELENGLRLKILFKNETDNPIVSKMILPKNKDIIGTILEQDVDYFIKDYSIQQPNMKKNNDFEVIIDLHSAQYIYNILSFMVVVENIHKIETVQVCNFRITPFGSIQEAVIQII